MAVWSLRAVTWLQEDSAVTSVLAVVAVTVFRDAGPSDNCGN